MSNFLIKENGIWQGNLVGFLRDVALSVGGSWDEESINVPGGLRPGPSWYVSRNKSASGDGSSWDKAFLTIGEAVAAANAAYTAGSYTNNRGRNSAIHIDEGWYGEVTMTLTASDCIIMGLAPGNMGRTVLYGSLTAGGFDDGNTGPALAITGGNNTIANMDFVNRSATIAGVYAGGVVHTEHPCILEGTYLVPVTYNKFINLGFMRDQVDAASWGIISYSADHTLIDGCVFNGVSVKEGGVAFQSGTGTNHSCDIVRNSYFYGTPTGIWQNSSHNTWIHDNKFTNQGAVASTLTNPCNIVGGTAYMFNNFAPEVTEANFNAGGSGVEKANICSNTDDTSYPDQAT